MPNSGDFDPAKAVDFDPAETIRQHRAAEEAMKQREEAEEQRRQAQEEFRRANTLKLLQYADAKLEDIRNPIVSEFVVAEMWRSIVGIIFYEYQTQKREISYYGSWLSLECARGDADKRWCVVKLRQPRAGYAYAKIEDDWDPRNVGNIYDVDPLDYDQIIRRRGPMFRDWVRANGSLQIFASLEEAAECLNHSVEGLTVAVRQALNFVATGQPPEPTYISNNDYTFD